MTTLAYNRTRNRTRARLGATGDCGLPTLAAALIYLAAARAARLHEENADADFGKIVRHERKRLGLTAREGDVLTLLADGLTNQEIAAELVISVRTAEHHVAHIMRKLDAPNRRAAAAVVRRLRERRPLAVA